MEDPIQRHPTRSEQLDLLATVMADAAARAGKTPVRILDLGCGTGYFAHRLMRRAPGLDFTGVDLSGDALAAASENLAGLDGNFTGVTGNLMEPESIELPGAPYDLACTCLTFHDLTDPGKQAVIAWVAKHLAEGGLFFIYDRVRLTEAALFPLQQSIWARIEDLHGRGMRTADSFEAYLSDLGQGNDPGAFEDYLRWYREAGFSPACLHLHGNVALFAGARSA